jgi:hypothetical protein
MATAQLKSAEVEAATIISTAREGKYHYYFYSHLSSLSFFIQTNQTIIFVIINLIYNYVREKGKNSNSSRRSKERG